MQRNHIIELKDVDWLLILIEILSRVHRNELETLNADVRGKSFLFLCGIVDGLNSTKARDQKKTLEINLKYERIESHKFLILETKWCAT